MAGQSHGDPLRDAGLNQVANAGPTEIVRYVDGLDLLDLDLAVLPGFCFDVTGQAGVVAGSRPCLAEARGTLAPVAARVPRRSQRERQQPQRRAAMTPLQRQLRGQQTGLVSRQRPGTQFPDSVPLFLAHRSHDPSSAVTGMAGDSSHRAQVVCGPRAGQKSQSTRKRQSFVQQSTGPVKAK